MYQRPTLWGWASAVAALAPNPRRGLLREDGLTSGCGPKS